MPRSEDVHIVTTEQVPGFAIKEVRGLVWGTTVRAKFVGKDIIALLRILVGGEVKEYTEMINDARFYVVQRLVENARKLGANAVVGTRFGSLSISPGAAEIFAFGTAVRVAPAAKTGK
ncbi:YbjQ family protein [Candidatus Micrarchaeota archaeon]|nr:YbjQ family protein [Candidatus Micrarchaeota archaeon]